jgi:hypothetical protein
MYERHGSIVAVFIAAGCASGPQPHSMSAAEHDRAARAEEVAAACGRPAGGDLASAPCWTSNRGSVDEHRAMAARHRAESAALRNAEAQACVGITESDRNMSPFEHAADIVSVEPYIQEERIGDSGVTKREAGAIVIFRAVPGLTAEWLQRLVDCHLARNAALGHLVPEMPNCPLVPRGVTASVRSVGNGFAVEVEGRDPDTAHAILARSQRLVASVRTSQL